MKIITKLKLFTCVLTHLRTYSPTLNCKLNEQSIVDLTTLKNKYQFFKKEVYTLFRSFCIN